MFSLFRLILMLVLLPLGWLSAAERPRYAARLADGSRLEHDNLTNWYKPEMPPRLNNQPLLEGSKPLRWLRNRDLRPSKPPTAFVEMFSGDRLPGEVVEGGGDASKAVRQSPYLTVRTQVEFRTPTGRSSADIRVLTPYVRRIVWRHRQGQTYRPGTLYYRDGRSQSFQAVRFRRQSAALLTDEGPLQVFFNEIAELHLPQKDFWEQYLRELAVLAPNGEERLLQLETVDGLIATTSLRRFRPYYWGNPRDPRYWGRGIQPAWSLDLLWLRHDRIWMRRSFKPSEVPLSRLAPSHSQQRSLLGQSGWRWRINRNVRGGLQRSGAQEYGWGIGVHAFSQLHFRLPPWAKRFQTEIGLDQIAGEGGCVRVRVYLDRADGKPLYESPIVVGSTRQPLSWAYDFPPREDQSYELILQVDPAHQQRPAGADPLDIRDSADWLDPLIELDGEQLKTQIRRAIPRRHPAWRDWAASLPEEVLVENAWRDLPNRSGEFFLQFHTNKRPLVLSKTTRLGRQSQWLLASVNQGAARSNRPRVQVRVNQEVVATWEASYRESWRRETPSLVVRLADFHASQDWPATVEIWQEPFKNQVPLRWEGVALADIPPMLRPLLEDDGGFAPTAEEFQGRFRWQAENHHSGKRAAELISPSRFRRNWKETIAIRERPTENEYRFLHFAYQKVGDGIVQIELHHPEEDLRPVIYQAGKGALTDPGVRPVQPQRLNNGWMVVSRDLYGEFGELDLRGFSLRTPDGEKAFFDQIYLARHRDDFRLLPPAPLRPQDLEASQKRVAELIPQAAPSVVEIEFPDGRRVAGAIVAHTGAILTVGREVLRPGQAVQVHLADGRKLPAKTAGVWRDRNLGLVQIEEKGSWPALPMNAPSKLEPRMFYAAFGIAPTQRQAPGSPARLVHLRRVQDHEIWIDAERKLRPETTPPVGAVLLDEYRRLIGVRTRRHGLGGWAYAAAHSPQVYLSRLQKGEVWGRWAPGAEPSLGAELLSIAGAQIAKLSPQGPAAKAGLRVDDTIVKAEGAEVWTVEDLRKTLANKEPGQELEVEYLREGETQKAKLKL